MKKTIAMIVMLIIACISFVGCGKEITLNLAYGDRTGTYSGDLVNGIPNGKGKFTTKNTDGESWTYEGEFKNGHFNGEGQITWESGYAEIGTYKDDVIVPLKGDEIKTLHTYPENFKNRSVEIVGKVFGEPEYTNDLVAFQMWSDLKNSTGNIIVYIKDKEFKVNSNDYLKITGTVGDSFKGSNSFGGEISAPTITARSYEKISYKDAVSPTLKSIEVNQTQTQHGYSVTVQKIEIAKEETRAYIKVYNGGSSRFNLYSFNSKITQNGKQYDQENNYEADYPKVQTDLLIMNSTEGIITFPAIEEEAFLMILEGRSENWNEKFTPYSFIIEV